jgi:hypothetical protein
MGAVGLRRFLSRHASLAVLVCFLGIGFVTFATGLVNPFLGDDQSQIVENPTIRSLGNLPQFFRGGTMYNGDSSGPLEGVFYRPIMTTAYSLIYAGFGLHPLPFHLVQLCLHVLGAWLAFLVLRYFFRTKLALILAAIFLVHPINSQSVFAIATLQEPLYLDFGLLAFWLMLRFKGHTWAVVAAGCALLLSMLSKETGLLFVLLIGAYLAIYDRRRLVLFGLMSALVVAAYFGLKINAVGLAHNPKIAPIDALSLVDRLANVPAIILGYVGLFLLPVSVASGYYWVHSYASFTGFWLPLIVVINLFLVWLYGMSRLYHRADRGGFWKYVFFSIWLGLGLGLHLQIIPLDMTLSSTWFYFAGVGALGMVGVVISQFSFTRKRSGAIIALGTVAILAALSAVRGLDWRSHPVLAARDVAIGEDSYVAENILAYAALDQGNYRLARQHAERSVRIWPAATNSDVLGRVLFFQGDYSAAKHTLVKGINHQPFYFLFEHYADVSIFNPEPDRDLPVLEQGVKLFPQNSTLWFALALVNWRAGDLPKAKMAIGNARKYGDSQDIREAYNRIMGASQ